MTSKLFFTPLACIFITSCGVSCIQSKKGKVGEIVGIQESQQMINLDVQEGQELVVKSVIDLQGKNAILPANVLILFKQGGAIVNGTLTGNETRINSKDKDVLGVKLRGTWCVNKIRDDAFSKEYLSDSDIIYNLNAIQSDTVANDLTITRDYTFSIPSTGGGGLIMSSNSNLNLESTLTLLPNNYRSYKIILIEDKQNVSIKGGILVGDVGEHDYIEGTTSEWGMGISILSSKSIDISNVYITKCTGDGIYISGGNESSVGIYDYASKNVRLSHIVCDGNRRQGLSIIHVDGLNVKNCSFINTGQFESTPPSAGLDIEPNVSNNRNMSVRNVLIENCTIQNNKGMAIATNNTYEADGRYNYENIIFSNCKTDGLLKAQSTDLTFRGCSFKEVRFASVYAPTHITMENCIVSGGYGIKIYTPSENGIHSKDRLLSIIFKDCTISVSEDQNDSDALFSCYYKYIPNIESITLENCCLIIPQSTEKKISFTDYPFMDKLFIISSVIEMQGRDFDSSGIILQGNKIHCHEAIKLPENSSNKLIKQ